MDYDNNKIQPILKIIDQKNMTAGELKKVLEKFPDDRKIHISVLIDGLEHSHFEIKDVSFVVEMDKNITHPVLKIDTIKFEVL